MGGRYIIDEDPLAKLLAPPPDETPEQRAVRLQLEAEARQVSERIDEQIKAERAALKKSKPVKVLLLGQSESGKSTTLKRECSFYFYFCCSGYLPAVHPAELPCPATHPPPTFLCRHVWSFRS